MKNKIVFYTTFSLLVSLISNKSYSIIEATIDQYDKHKSVVSIQSRIGDCSAVVIHPYILLTAAHCVEGLNPYRESKDIKVFFNNNNNGRDNVGYAAMYKRHVQFPKTYKPDYNYDIAAIILAKPAPIQISDMIKTATPNEVHTLNIRPGAKATIVGYGSIGEYTNGFRHYKQVEVLRKFGCVDFGDNVVRFSEGTRVGDSGGGAFMLMPDGSKRLVGISSTYLPARSRFGIKVCGSSNYTLTHRFYDWIEKNTGYYPGVDFNQLTEDIKKKYRLD